MSSPIYVIYHENCRDGFGAAWAAWTTLGHRTPNGNPVHYIPSNYGHPPPDTDPDGTVYILDFSYDLGTMTALHHRHNGRITLLDHHKSAMEELQGKVPGCHFAQDLSGAVMAWNFFHPFARLPKLLAYVQDRDLWKFELPRSRDINAALEAAPMDFDTWSALNLDELAAEGHILLGPRREAVDALAQAATTVTIDGVPVPAVETTELVSETGERLLQLHPEAPFAALWHRREDGTVKFSLRSRGDTDVAVIAQKYGGGGHAAAAGFATTAEDSPAKAGRNP